MVSRRSLLHAASALSRLVWLGDNAWQVRRRTDLTDALSLDPASFPGPLDSG